MNHKFRRTTLTPLVIRARWWWSEIALGKGHTLTANREGFYTLIVLANRWTSKSEYSIIVPNLIFFLFRSLLSTAIENHTSFQEIVPDNIATEKGVSQVTKLLIIERANRTHAFFHLIKKDEVHWRVSDCLLRRTFDEGKSHLLCTWARTRRDRKNKFPVDIRLKRKEIDQFHYSRDGRVHVRRLIMSWLTREITQSGEKSFPCAHRCNDDGNCSRQDSLSYSSSISPWLSWCVLSSSSCQRSFLLDDERSELTWTMTR